jgi:hypothetical protein
LIQEENLLIRKSVRQCQLELIGPDRVKPALYEDQGQSDNVIDLGRFKDNNCQPIMLGSNDVLLQDGFSDDTLQSVRDPFIQRYRQTQQNGAYFKSKASLEITI